MLSVNDAHYLFRWALPRLMISSWSAALDALPTVVPYSHYSFTIIIRACVRIGIRGLVAACHEAYLAKSDTWILVAYPAAP